MGTEAPRRLLDGEALFAAAELDVEARQRRQDEVVRGGLRPQTVLMTLFGRRAPDPQSEARTGRLADGSGTAGGAAQLPHA
jgi:hypothetical protein